MIGVICGNNATRRKANAENADAADVGVCQVCRKCLCCSAFLNLRFALSMRE